MTGEYTMDARLCEDDGMVRGGFMHHGADYFCTGSAHHAGQHIRCTNPRHTVTYTTTYPQVVLADERHCGGCRCGGRSGGQVAVRLGGGGLPPWGYVIQ